MDLGDYIECALSEIRDGNEDFPLRAGTPTRHSYFTRAGAGGDRPLLLSAALPYPLRAGTLTRHSYLTRAGAGGDRPLLLSAALPYPLRAGTLTRHGYLTRAEVRNKACGCRLGTVGKNLDFRRIRGILGRGITL